MQRREKSTLSRNSGIQIIRIYEMQWKCLDLGQCTIFPSCYRQNFCVEPPCGQLNPMKEEIYEILEQIFLEYFEIFHFDSFHYGGDEVDFRCWRSEEAVTGPMEGQYPTTDEGFNIIDFT